MFTAARLIRATTVVALALIASAAVYSQTKLLRFPDIRGDRVVFTYGGDLWTAPSSGGMATHLTSHPGVELFAKFSPDGKWIAFTGQYDGDEQVYVVPTTGGEPRQLTFYPARGPLPPRWGYENQVYGWSKDGKQIYFRSTRDSWSVGIARLYAVSIDGGPAEPLPMPQAGSGDYSPSGTEMVYSPQARDFRSEKRYSGGQVNHLYIFNLGNRSAKQITHETRATRDPMWVGDTIFYNSDKDGHFNLYAYAVSSGRTTQVTSNRQYDVRWPSSDNENQIVYELNGELQVFDTRSRKSAPISINVPDEGIARRPSRVAVGNQIQSVGLSPKAERVLFAARGDIFTAPIEKGPTRNLTHSSGAFDKWPSWSPDGSQIAFVSDMSGEEELYLMPQDGSKPAEQITRGGTAMRYGPEWAPDGKRLAFSDKDGKVYILTLADRKVTEIADARRGQVRDYIWSPRGNYLAFTMPNQNAFTSIYIWSAADGQLRRVTEENNNSYNPVWDPQGNYLFFFSDREYLPQLSTVEFNFATNRTTQIYAMTLRKDVKHPFPPESDEVTVAKTAADDAAKPAASPAPDKPAETPTASAAAEPKPEAAPKLPANLVIDFDGIQQRVAKAPIAADNYFGLTAKPGFLLYAIGGAGYYGRQGDRTSTLKLYSLKDRKETTLAEDIRGYTLADDGSKVLVGQGPAATTWNLYDATPTGDRTRKAVSTAGLFVDRVPAEEWNQIFNEVWRRYRDWFYVSNMHGFDWEALREQYKPLLKYVAHRSDLNYVIHEMIAELTVQHAYIDGGDFQVPPRPRYGLPGARFELDRAAGRYRIAKIFTGENEEDIYRSPLTEVGVNASVGDYVLAIDGEELKANDDPYRLLRNKADNPVQLTLNKTPTMQGARTVSYRPISDESNLIYLDWIEGNRAKVAKATNGRVGYMHLPDMGANGIREFIKWYYPQLNKEAMIVDVRANGGGNVSRMIIERLRRKVLALGYSRTNDDATTYPDAVFPGPMVSILDENSGSDGDIFPAMFREAGLGPLIGKRSWGGVVGITNRGTLIDGGVVNVPEFGFASKNGEWVIEGYGVDPDIEVDNDPNSVLAGKDPQLERAITEIMLKLKNPVKLPRKPAPPVKTIKDSSTSRASAN